MFTSTQSLKGLEKLAFDQATATALQLSIAYLSECADLDAPALIERAQALLKAHGHPWHLDDCIFMRDCVINEELDRDQQRALKGREGY